MIPQLEIINRPLDRSFIVHAYAQPQFEFVWHRHPQLELTLIQSGRGQRFVGNSIESFEPGDLVLLGPNLPHTWLSLAPREAEPEPASNANASANASAAIVLFFERDSFGPAFFKLPEMTAVDRMLNQAEHGLVFKDESIGHAITSLLSQDNATRVPSMISILQRLAHAERRTLSAAWRHNAIGTDDCSRLDRVCAHLNNHYADDIRIDDLAAMLQMTTPGFCRFFKRMMGRTLISYLHELRIAEVCRRLAETDRSITDIAYACGFSNLAHFNRVFKRLRQQTPRQWRKTL